MNEDDEQARKWAEQRASDRVRIGSPALLKVGEEESSGFVEVINLGGVYVATPRAPELGDYVDLVFSLPNDPRSFRVRGSVVFVEPGQEERQRSGFGARFERPPVALLDAIRGMGDGH